MYICGLITMIIERLPGDGDSVCNIAKESAVTELHIAPITCETCQASGYVRPERVNKWPNSMTDI